MQKLCDYTVVNEQTAKYMLEDALQHHVTRYSEQVGVDSTILTASVQHT